MEDVKTVATENGGKIKIESFERYSMYAPTDRPRKPKLSWAIRDGNPRVSVFTNDPNDTTNKGIITAPMDPITFMDLLDMLKKVAHSAPDSDPVYLDCRTSARDENGKPTGDIVPLSQVWMGKDKDGIVWISVFADGRPRIKFPFTMSPYHGIYKSNGTSLTPAEGSVLTAMSTAAVLDKIYGMYFENTCLNRYVPQVKREGAEKPRSGGDDMSFDDIPM